MKTTNTLYSRLALITSVTLITGYFIVSAVWVPMNNVGTGDQLTATLWNTFVGNLNDLDTRVKSTASVWPTVTGGIAYTGGNVGIGTASPISLLHLKAPANVSTILSFEVYGGTVDRLWKQFVSPSDGKLYIQDGTASVNRMTIDTIGNIGIGTTDPGGYRTAIRGSTDDNTASALWVSGAASLTGALVVRNDGNVGIGTATPLRLLSLKGSVPVLRFEDTDAGWAAGEINVNNAFGSIIIDSDASNTTAGSFTSFQVDSAEKMRIDSIGNVGIGTTVPHAKIHTLWQTFMMGSTTDLVWGSVGTVFQWEFGAASGNTYTKLESFIGGWSTYGNLVINPGGGNVWIGTTTPMYPLQVAGNLSLGNRGTAGTSYIWKLRETWDGIVNAYGIGFVNVDVNGAGYITFHTTPPAGVANNERMRIDQNGSVGIGNINPGLTRLRVTQTVDNQWASYIESTSPTAGFNFWVTIRAGTSSADAGFTVMDKTSTNFQLYVRGDGNVGIGTGTPWYKLTVNGQPAANGYTAFTNYSDKRLKENISGIWENMLDKIMKLRPVEYHYNDKYFSITWYDKATKDKTYKWFIAQELQKVFPEMVGERPFGNEKYLDTDLSNLQIYMVKAMQELKKENDELKKRIEKLEKR